MENEKTMLEKMMELFFRAPKVVESVSYEKIGFDFYDNAAVGYTLCGETITKFYSVATVKDGRKIDTRTAKRKSIKTEKGENECVFTAVYEENKLALTTRFTVKSGDNCFVATATVKELKNAVTESNYIAPLDFAYPDKTCKPLFLSLEQKMLLVPYDNDMWVRYESAPLRPGRTSYDVTAIYNEEENYGLIIGALDFFEWKNAIRCSANDARCYTAFSGVADSCTHDVRPHGYLDGDEVTSSRFMVGWFSDVREGLMDFGKRAMEGKFSFSWNKPNPFGWNSYSAGCMTLEEWQTAGRFIHDELPEFCDENGATYINLDANFMLNKKKMQSIVDELHARGQKAGNYMAPLLGNEDLALVMPLKGSFGHSFKDIIMRDEKGNLYPKIDSGRPVDITNPIAEKHVRACIREIVEMNFDYIKIDFVAHGSVEGMHYDKSVKTGRQALKRFYDILADELDPKKIGRDIFVDLSIAPLFPGGYGHARRASCDAFGHHEDVRYVLNALNFGFWQSGSLYAFNDPDHTVLYESKVDGRGETDEASARSRYNASVVSGTVMLLSDNYGKCLDDGVGEKARARARLIANNAEINRIARLGKPFIPTRLQSYTSNSYYLREGEKLYVALFNFENRESVVSVSAKLVGAGDNGECVNLTSGTACSYSGDIAVDLAPYDSCILEVK